MSSPSPDSAPSSNQGNKNSTSSPSSSPPSDNQGNSNSTSPSPPSPPSSQSPPSSDSPPASDSSSSSPSPPSNSKSPPDSSDSPPSSNKSPPDSDAGGKSKNHLPPPSSNGNSNPKSNGGSKSPPPALPGDKKSDGGGSDNSDVIIGGAVGAVCLLLIIIIACLVSRRRRKRKEMYYYDEPEGKAAKSGDYKKAGQDHVVKMQQSPNGVGMGPNSSSSAWGPVPPPPPPHSADMSSNYSLGPPPPLPPPSPGVALGLMGGTFTYEDLAAATENFAEKNLLGQGGFGYVHKGLLPNGKEVAVKSLKAGSGQGEREFQAEIDMLSRVHHRHLVSLNGYCIAGGQRMLVYEFVPNQTLEYHLHGKGLPTMPWRDRMRIAVGSAKGLAYLHEDCHPRIIHRDIKSANVLLDDSFEAKVADFGLAKLTNDNNTHVSTRVMGTFGYLAPEYASSGKLTEKSDVFSFGVMLLELITGKRPVDVLNAMDDSLVDWARPLLTRGLEDGHFEELVDPFLEGNYNQQELSRMAACASASIRHSGKKRPKMSQIVRGLEGDVSLDDLNEAKPGQANVLASPSSSDYDSSTYQADMKRFRQIALASQEFGSSDGGSSGEMTHHRPNIPRNPYG